MTNRAVADKIAALERFPKRMRMKPRWICWFWGDRKTWKRFDVSTLEPYDGHLWHRGYNGKLTRAEKLPINVHTMRAASVNRPTTWATFDSAASVLQGGAVDGLGYVLDRDEVMLDLDGCVLDNGDLSLFARTCMAELDSYAEHSVSGQGVHILCVASDFVMDRGCKAERLEVYAGGQTNRYATVTGNVINGFDDLNTDAEDTLTGIYQDEFADRPIVTLEAYRETAELLRGIEEESLSPEDARAVAWMCGHFHWGRSLFERGDYMGWANDRANYQPHKARSASEADAALTAYLLAATGGDPDRTLSLLYASKMWRPKYDEIHDGKNPYSVITVAKVFNAINATKMREDAFSRRDKVLQGYPPRMDGLVSLMRRDDVTDSMLRRVMSTHASGDAWQDERTSPTNYPLALIDWIVARWPKVVELAYWYDLEGVSYGR